MEYAIHLMKDYFREQKKAIDKVFMSHLVAVGSKGHGK